MEAKEAKKGMWAGKRGLAAGAEQNKANRDSIHRALAGQLGQLFRALEEVEVAIDRAGKVLSISQPARAIGKYGLRWWRLESRPAAYREPVIVRWMPQKNGVMTPRPAKMLKAKESGSYAINAAVTQECLQVLSGLIKRRSEIKARIFSLSKSLRGLDHVSFRINNEVERLDILKAQAVSNLQSAGYDLEPRYLEN